MSVFKQQEGKKSGPAPAPPTGRPVSAALSFESMLAQIGRTLDAATAARENDTAHAHALQTRVAELERQVRDLDERFTEILAERFQQAEPDTPTSDLQGHYDLADAFNRLFADVDRELTDIYAQVAHTRPNLTQRARWTAELLAYLHDKGELTRIDAEILRVYELDDSPRARISLLADNFDDLCRRAAVLKPAFTLAFDFTPGAVQPEMQRPWKNCNPEGRVEFIVTPAYCVAHRVLLPQEVFTIPWPAERG